VHLDALIYGVTFTMAAGEVTVPFVPGADAVALTTAVDAGNKVPIKKP
jgi:hypothetical protein